MVEITQKFKQIVGIGCYLIINIVLLAFYASLVEGEVKDYNSYRGLSITGNILMMIGFILIVALHFKYIYYAALGIIATMNFGLFLLLIGMGMGSKYYEEVDYNLAVAFWFIHLAIDILGMQVLLKVHKENQGGKEEGKGPQQKSGANNVAQPQVQQ